MFKPRPLNSSIQYIKGVGPKIAEKFASRGVRTLCDALYFLPRRYEQRNLAPSILDLLPGQGVYFYANVLDLGVRRAGRMRMIFEMLVGDKKGSVTCRWFNFSRSFAQQFKRGDPVKVSGNMEVYRGARQFVHPEIEKIDSDQTQTRDSVVISIYPEIAGMYPKTTNRIIQRIVTEFADQVVEFLPASILQEHKLMGINEAIQQVHFPDGNSSLEGLKGFRSPGHYRLVFEEFFLLQLGLALKRSNDLHKSTIGIASVSNLADKAQDLFGFGLTQAQKRVIEEITCDMASNHPMNRLLQGDVGSGKTAVAVLAALAVSRAGAQTALMAPTEILAEQHYLGISKIFQRRPDKFRVVFLSSSVKAKAREKVLSAINSGTAQLVVGTQALIEESVTFKNMALAIIDEQHRFGVIQRARLRSKSREPHVLVMTATPIPRTLAMTVFGDLDVSVLDELPPGRTPIKTIGLHTKQVGTAYRHIRNEVEKGGQAYVIYPLVEESEKMALLDASSMFEQLGQGILKGLRLALLHGRIPAEERNAVMQRFSNGELDVLVATTVVEVGVDVPNASVMVIEHAERFGLSQMHQLRGRVGRGHRKGTCYLVVHQKGSADARARVQVMEKSNDGFRISEEDLAIRGPGEFLGTRQSGLPVFTVGDLLRDGDILAQARRAAFSLVAKDRQLNALEHRPLRQAVLARWGERLMLAEIG
jgi:ATP-dependent DNA helicase RecG